MPKRKPKAKQTRGPRGEGSVLPDKRRGGYIGKVPIGKYPNRRTRYKTVWAPTHAECVAAKKLVRPPGPETTVSQWADRWLAELSVRDSSKADYAHTVEKYIRPTLGHLRVCEVTAGDVERAARLWSKTLGANTLKKDLGHLGTMFDAARRSGLGNNPVGHAKRPRAKRVDIRPLSPAELATVITRALASPTDLPYALLAAVGCRLGEALALDVQDFDARAGTIRITKTYSAKFGVRPPKSENGIRTIRVPAPALPAIVRAAGARKSGVLFATTGGKLRRQHSTLQRRWKGFLAACGIEYRSVHTTRHSVATALVSAGVPIGDVAKFLGDAVGTIVKRYVHASGADPALALEGLFGGGISIP